MTAVPDIFVGMDPYEEAATTPGHAVTSGGKLPEIDVGEFFDWRPKFGDEPKTHVHAVRTTDTADRLLNATQQKYQYIYPTKADIIRDAIWLLCAYLYHRSKSPDPEISSLLRVAQAAGNAKYTAELRERIAQHTHDVQDSIVDALCDGNLEECHRQIVQFWDAVSSIPDDWIRDKFLTAARDCSTIGSVVRILHTYGYAIDADCVAQLT